MIFIRKVVKELLKMINKEVLCKVGYFKKKKVKVK